MADARRRILVVDDAEDNVDLLKRRLEKRGYRVMTAMSGPAALDLIDREPIDLVLLDVMMPDMNGVEVLEILRRSRPRDMLPVIMATAKSDSADVVKALEKGANDYVTKPIQLEVLLARMRVHLGAPPQLTQPTGHAAVYVAVGNVLDRKYRLEAEIGSGGFGTVYRATHLALAKEVAVKVLHSHLVESNQAMRRFEIEGISACRVQHPNAVSVLDAGTTSLGVPYLVMELLHGRSLSAELKRKGALRLGRAAEICTPLCNALAEAHRQGIVHRDVTPSNVLLSRNHHGDEVVKVLDFGIAKLVEQEPPSDQSRGEVMGTPDYMAPERLMGESSDARADVYGVGVILYQMLSGTLPYPRISSNFVKQAMTQINTPATSLLATRPDLPQDLSRVVMASLARAADARPALDELRDAVTTAASQWTEPQWPPPSLGALVPSDDAPMATPDARTRTLGSDPAAMSSSGTVEKHTQKLEETGSHARDDMAFVSQKTIRSSNDGNGA